MPDATNTPRNPSYWKQTSEPAGYARLDGRVTADVAVIGAGIVGITTAYLLKQSGMNVVVLEAHRVGEGTTGYSSSKLTSLHGLKYASLEASIGENGARLYAEANQWAIEAIADIVEELEIDCQFERHPALTYTRSSDEADAFEDEFQAARRAGLPLTRVLESDLPFPIAAGLKLEGQASFHPLRYCLALAADVDGGGSQVYEQSRIVEIDDDRDPIVMRTRAGGTVEAPHAVLACGIPFLDRGGFFARVHPSRSYCVAMDGASRIPDTMSINTGSPTISIRPITGPDERKLLLITGADHKVGRAEDTEGSYRFLEAVGKDHFGAAGTVARWSAQDYISIDDVPLIGRMRPASKAIYVATGFGKWGLTMGTAAARILRDRIRDHENPWEAVFDAGRSQIPGGLGEALKEGVGDARRFMGDRIRQMRVPPVQDLSPGTGGIREHEGSSVAAFRDARGRLHMVKPTCTHLGCRVVWNQAEKSWDCPCHGSRFSIGGEILNGPAVDPLERI